MALKDIYKIKVVVIGANAVGKTSLIRRYVTHKFSEAYNATIGMDITVKEIDLTFGLVSHHITISLHDLAGQYRFESLHKNFLKSADAAIIVAAQDEPESLHGKKDVHSDRVISIYDWVDRQVENNSSLCKACGQCCDFERFGHRLYITTPEMIYFKEKMSSQAVKQMSSGICPYNLKGKCAVYKYRFAGCRIFSCKGDRNKQSSISEEAVSRFRSVCREFEIDYRYTDLKTVLSEG